MGTTKWLPLLTHVTELPALSSRLRTRPAVLRQQESTENTDLPTLRFRHAISTKGTAAAQEKPPPRSIHGRGSIKSQGRVLDLTNRRAIAAAEAARRHGLALAETAIYSAKP